MSRSPRTDEAVKNYFAGTGHVNVIIALCGEFESALSEVTIERDNVRGTNTYVRELLAPLAGVEPTRPLENIAAHVAERVRALSDSQLDAKRMRVLIRWGVRHSMDSTISDPAQPYYVCLKDPDGGSCSAHGATLAIVADRAIEWLESRGITWEAPK